jgi:hypothetical protein
MAISRRRSIAGSGGARRAGAGSAAREGTPGRSAGSRGGGGICNPPEAARRALPLGVAEPAGAAGVGGAGGGAGGPWRSEPSGVGGRTEGVFGAGARRPGGVGARTGLVEPGGSELFAGLSEPSGGVGRAGAVRPSAAASPSYPAAEWASPPAGWPWRASARGAARASPARASPCWPGDALLARGATCALRLSAVTKNESSSAMAPRAFQVSPGRQISSILLTRPSMIHFWSTASESNGITVPSGRRRFHVRVSSSGVAFEGR